ncbi:MAG TPA: hypothetical protein DCW29_18200 [Janthinobacterium sp.]|nr:hypothetical protein [Janthinobacterium sp.]
MAQKPYFFRVKSVSDEALRDESFMDRNVIVVQQEQEPGFAGRQLSERLSEEADGAATVPAIRRAQEALHCRVVARPDTLTAQKVEVSMVFLSMLGVRDAARYLASNDISLDVALRVLTRPHSRRG